jgi:hypothetical protein
MMRAGDAITGSMNIRFDICSAVTCRMTQKTAAAKASLQPGELA